MKQVLLFSFFLLAQCLSAQRFAVIGDFGFDGVPEADVAAMIKSKYPYFIVTTGDNNYPSGAASTIDLNIGKHYHEFIAPYYGNYGPGSNTNRFFPSIGNHDWATASAQPHIDYFTLPGNERYYDTLIGNVHLFILNSQPGEPDGVSDTSVQANWLELQLERSTGIWKLVFFHHPPYSSDAVHGNQTWMQWPFGLWGADIVFAGHAHTYERLHVNNLPYIISGLGGRSIYGFSTPKPGSEVRYNSDYGAVIAEANPDSLTVRFITRANDTIDTYTLRKPTTHVYAKPKASLNKVFPNPAQSVAHLTYSVNTSCRTQIKVYDVTGRTIAILPEHSLNPGDYSVELDVSNYPQGIYYYKIIFDGSEQAGKLLVTGK